MARIISLKGVAQLALCLRLVVHQLDPQRSKQRQLAQRLFQTCWHDTYIWCSYVTYVIQGMDPEVMGDIEPQGYAIKTYLYRLRSSLDSIIHDIILNSNDRLNAAAVADVVLTLLELGLKAATAILRSSGDPRSQAKICCHRSVDPDNERSLGREHQRQICR